MSLTVGLLFHYKHLLIPWELLKTLKKLYFKELFINVRRMLLFMVEQVFLTMDSIWSIYNADIQCTVDRREEARQQRKSFSFKHSLTYLKYEFLYFYLLLDWLYFTVKYLFQERFMDANFMNNFIFDYFYLLNTWKTAFLFWVIW